MPIMDGPTAAKHLREGGDEIPIIGVTGNVLPADIDYYVQHGANLVIGKPVNISLLDSSLQRLVHERQQRDIQLYQTSPCVNYDNNIDCVPSVLLAKETI